MTPPNPLFRGLWVAVLASSTFLSVVGGIIAAAVYGAWKWTGVPVVIGAVFIAELFAAHRREARVAELEELAGPLPASDEIDAEWLALHLRAWSEEG